ncbi:MAG: TerC family protein [Verrucomicrobiota bacterium]|jgi:tellurite resistance protein TerC
MPLPVPITLWHWTGFILVILLFLALDLGFFHRSNRADTSRQAVLWSVGWFFLAVLFARGLRVWRGPEESLEFLTAYFVEFSLSMDNVAAIALIFTFFAVPARYQHRLLFQGIFGALVLRGVMIGLGVTLIHAFQWTLYLLGAFLIFTGLKWGCSKQPSVRPENNLVLRLARRILPVSSDYDGDKLLTRVGGRRALTPLALVLLMVETADLIFAVDSIPAVLAVTQKPFIVFTSNVFAILGLRSLYFAVAGAIRYFRFLKTGVAGVLIFVGVKMLASPWVNMPTALSLAVVAAMIALSIGFSIWYSWQIGGKEKGN